jgi:RNA polymerase sigma factor (sigma-70 family)
VLAERDSNRQRKSYFQVLLRIFMPYESFFELPSVTNEDRLRWIVDTGLSFNIKSLCEQIEPCDRSQESVTEMKLARFLFLLLRQYPEDKLIQAHWQAFLFKRCEKVARQISYLLPTNCYRNLFLDFFQMGCELVAFPFDFLESFDDRRPKLNYWYATLKKFSDHKIKFSLFPRVREIIGLPTLGQSDLGLAARASRKQVKEALMNSRYNLNSSQYLLIWQCFQEVRKSVKLEVNKFKVEQFQLICDRYHQLQSHERLKIDGNEIKSYLEDVGSALRQLLDFQPLSLDIFLDSNSESESSLKDFIADPATNIDGLSSYEMQQAIERLRQVLNELLENLKPVELQQILWLRHGLNLKQKEMSLALALDQATISRKLKTLYQEIFLQLAQIAHQGSQIDFEITSEAIAEIKVLLDDYYTERVDRFLIEILSLLDSSKKELLKSIYLDSLSVSKLQTTEAEIEWLLDEIKHELSDSFMQRLETEIDLTFLPQSETREMISSSIETITVTNLQHLLD